MNFCSFLQDCWDIGNRLDERLSSFDVNNAGDNILRMQPFDRQINERDWFKAMYLGKHFIGRNSKFIQPIVNYDDILKILT